MSMNYKTCRMRMQESYLLCASCCCKTSKSDQSNQPSQYSNTVRNEASLCDPYLQCKIALFSFEVLVQTALHAFDIPARVPLVNLCKLVIKQPRQARSHAPGNKSPALLLDAPVRSRLRVDRLYSNVRVKESKLSRRVSRCCSKLAMAALEDLFPRPETVLLIPKSSE